MSRQIKDIKDKNTGNLVYPRTHAKAVVINEGTSLEDLIGIDVGNRLDTLESTIKTDGTGNLYLSDDGSYKEVITETELTAKRYTTNIGTITGIKMNGASKGTSGVVDLGTVITAHQDISGKLDKTVAASTYATKTEVVDKQDKVLKFTNKQAASWVNDSTYENFPYRCDIDCSGVTADMYPEVIFDVTQATSGDYAPVCETGNNIVSIWATTNSSINIPVIVITK